MSRTLKTLLATAVLVPAFALAGDVDPQEVQELLNTNMYTTDSADQISKEIEMHPTAAGKSVGDNQEASQRAWTGHLEGFSKNGDL